jgi:hypothetical protein
MEEAASILFGRLDRLTSTDRASAREEGQTVPIAESDDLHISPFRDDGVTYGTPTWILSVVVRPRSVGDRTSAGKRLGVQPSLQMFGYTNP